jgi:CHAD domain-containing protein
MNPPRRQPPAAETARQLASRTLAALAASVWGHERGVIAGEVEAVHDMRVLIRRLRVALSNFAACFDAAGRRAARAELSKLADKLGAVRDLDVLIAALESRRAKLAAEHQPHIQTFVRRLRARRRRRQRQLTEYLSGEDYTRLKRQFVALVQPPPAETAREADAPRGEQAGAPQEGYGQAA